MSNPIKLTLGQAAKEVGISKPSLSVAIKKGRISANKNDSGVYEIDPAELFRVYPQKRKPNALGKQEGLPASNPHKAGKTNSKVGISQEVLDLLLGEREKLIAEKDARIKNILDDKEKMEELLDKQVEQTKKITLLLEHQSGGPSEWERAFKALEDKVSNQEERLQKEKEELERNERKSKSRLKKARLEIERLQEELEAKSKPFWKIWG